MCVFFFNSSLVDELKESIFPVLRILLQHICAKVPVALIIIIVIIIILKIYKVYEVKYVCVCVCVCVLGNESSLY